METYTYVFIYSSQECEAQMKENVSTYWKYTYLHILIEKINFMKQH